MKPLYVLDLEGTTGIYSKCYEINDTIELRDGFRKLIKMHDEEIRIALFTSSSEDFVNEVLRNLKRKKIDLKFPVYTSKDISLGNGLRNGFHKYYKRYEKIFSDNNIRSPEDEAIIIGDFLRFSIGRGYTQKEYMEFCFRKNPEVLYQNFALNDHPYPYNENLPIYVVLPQPWTTIENHHRFSLSFEYVIGFIENMRKIGKDSFIEGAMKIKEQLREDEYVSNNDLARLILNKEATQRYLVMKGRKEDWKPLEKVL